MEITVFYLEMNTYRVIVLTYYYIYARMSLEMRKAKYDTVWHGLPVWRFSTRLWGERAIGTQTRSYFFVANPWRFSWRYRRRRLINFNHWRGLFFSNIFTGGRVHYELSGQGARYRRMVVIITHMPRPRSFGQKEWRMWRISLSYIAVLDTKGDMIFS